MAHFYGTLNGSGKTAGTRCGTKNSGMETIAASWQGAVQTRLYVDDDGVDCALVSLVPWRGEGVKKVLYNGPVGG